MTYTAHLAKDENHNFTACGEPWQGWQEPFDADLADAGPTLPPMDAPRPHRDQIRQCQACLRATHKHATSSCDHCEGTGEVWEPCHVHADFCPQSCEQKYVPCGNCDGSGREKAQHSESDA